MKSLPLKIFCFALILTFNFVLSVNKKNKNNLGLNSQKLNLKNRNDNKITKKTKNKEKENAEKIGIRISLISKEIDLLEKEINDFKKNKKNKNKNSNNNKKSFFNFLQAEKQKNRLTRFIWALLFVILFTVGLFFIVKSSVDWATRSKGELNKLKDQRMREITDLLNNEFKRGN